MALSPRDVWRGNPPSPIHSPDPGQIVDLIDSIMTMLGAGASYWEDTLTDLEAVSGAVDGDIGFVLDDGASSGVYTFDGTDWNKTAELPEGFAAIQNGDIDNAKLADVATGILKGRVTAGTGDVEDLTAAQVRTLLNVEDGATADQTGAEIKAAYEGEENTNAFTDVEKAKLAGIGDGAQPNAVESVAGKTGAVTLVKADVGLGNVDNTSDADKPVSTATQTALDGKAPASHTSDTSNPHSVTKTQVGLGAVDNTADADKPVSNATQAALDPLERAMPEQSLAFDQMASVLAASGGETETIVQTADGYAAMRRVGDTLYLWGVPLQLDLDEGFEVQTADGYPAFKVSRDGRAVIGGLQLELTGLSYEMQTRDGIARLFSFREFDGAARLSVAPESLFISGDSTMIEGQLQPGAVSAVQAAGDWFAYSVSSPHYSGRVIGRRTGDAVAPHLADFPEIEVWWGNGQSWMTISDYSAEETIYEDSSGQTAAAIRAAITPLVNILRDSDFVDVPASDLEEALLPTISNWETAGDFHRFIPASRYSIARMSAAAYTRFGQRLGAEVRPQVVLQTGWPGTSAEYFLPEGAERSYLDDDGVLQDLVAVEHDGPSPDGYLWAIDDLQLQAVADFVEDRYPGRRLGYRFLQWIQGPTADAGEQAAFQEEFREQMDGRDIPGQTAPLHILWDQTGGKVERTTMLNGGQSQLEFCQDNASGKDWLVGPRYPHKMRDDIHHSSFGALEYAERSGQAAAYLDVFGDWEPLWITNVGISGADVTLTINQPRQCVGELIVDEDHLGAIADYGFTLWNADTNSAIAINSVSIGSDTITLTAAAALSGNVEVGYAARAAAANPSGTVSVPSWSACWGTIKRKGRDAPAIIPASVQPTLDHWLCAYRKIHAV